MLDSLEDMGVMAEDDVGSGIYCQVGAVFLVLLRIAGALLSPVE